ncbi:MAG: hypothetical protein LBV10_17530 [Stenotrophomonas sp.]|jgi:hypothetical protein|uniref:hypothetical protein n=1 Tax=Stenotrophomonas sp. TaxID=69392 RepID=UPI00283E1737|nr:hypothetical protein [Stenotrophomonas sp.]MDR2961321.1 hypothetical protein [Stenotrophomonas sp.]
MRIWQSRALLGFTLAAFCGGLAADNTPITPHSEYYKRIRTGEMVSPLSSDLFGERITLSSGATEFVVTDIGWGWPQAIPGLAGYINDVWEGHNQKNIDDAK